MNIIKFRIKPKPGKNRGADETVEFEFKSQTSHENNASYGLNLTNFRN